MTKPRAQFYKFLRELATRAPDAMTLWRQAKTPQEKEIVKKIIVSNARKKALMRDEIAGFLRTLSLENLSAAHRYVFDIHTGQVILSLASKKGKLCKSKDGPAKK